MTLFLDQKAQSVGVVQKLAHAGIQYEEFREDQDNHWIGDELRLCNKYPKDWWENIYTRSPKIQRKDFLPS